MTNRYAQNTKFHIVLYSLLDKLGYFARLKNCLTGTTYFTSIEKLRAFSKTLAALAGIGIQVQGLQ